MSQLSLLVDNPDAARKSRQLVVFASSLGTFTKETLSCQPLARMRSTGAGRGCPVPEESRLNTNVAGTAGHDPTETSAAHDFRGAEAFVRYFAKA
jgi:hypothetical protein